jgi:hypothetical protein
MSEARRFPTGNAESRISNSEENTAGLRDRKDSLRSRTSNILSRSRSRGRTEERRPGTAGRFSRSKSRSRNENEGAKRRLSCRRNRSISNLEEAKDLADLPPPPLTRLDCMNVQGDPSLIGVALGSPSQLQPTYPGLLGHSPLTKTEVEDPASNDDYFDDPANKSKGARWKKIGGLFKAKNALLNEQETSAFYQLQEPRTAQLGNENASKSHPRPADPGPGDHDARYLFDKILGTNGQLAQPNRAVDPLHPTSAQDSSRGGLPLLDVKIPDVHMERYSVMFGSLLDRQEPVNLLARREKTMNKLTTISVEKEGPSKLAHEQKEQFEKTEATSNNKGNSHLTPQANTTYPRRATSPTPSKSPSFSLFPQLPQAAEKIVGPIPPGKQSPLHRSFTAPGRLSPMQENFEFEEVQPLKPKVMKADGKTIASPPQTASTPDPKHDSSTPSNKSPTSTRSSLHEDLLLSMKSLGSLKRKQADDEVFYEHDLKVAPLKPRHFADYAHSGVVQAETELKKPNWPDMHEDTLAALERPRSVESRSRDISSLKPSKSRIDQIMRGAPINDPLSKSPAEVKKGPAFPQRSESKVSHESPQNIEIVPALLSQAERGPSEASTATLPAKDQTPAVTSRGGEPALLPSHTHAKQRSQGIQQPLGYPQPSIRDDSTASRPLEKHPSYAAHPPTKEAQIAMTFPTGQPPHSSQTGQRRPGQNAQAQAQSRPFAANPQYRPHPHVKVSTSRQPPNASNRSFPRHRPPPQKFAIPPRIAFNQMHPPQGPNYHSPPTPPTEKDQDNIIDYYLDSGEAKSSSQRPKPPKKLQKRLSEKPKKRLSLSNKPLPHIRSDSKSSDGVPRSPVPISKYSPNAVAAQRPLDSPTITSTTYIDYDPKSHSLADSGHFSPAVRAAREKAAQLVKASLAEKSPSTQPESHSRSITNYPSHSRPAQVEFSLIVDAPKTTSDSVMKAGTSFYSHSDGSTPTMESPPEAPRTENVESISIKQPNQSSVPARSSSRGASLSSLPSGAGGAEYRSTTSKPVPPQPIRSRSAGTVGFGPGTSGIQEHLKPEKGEKVVERQAGTVPTIVDPERHGVVMRGFGHHRAGRSVNLVIESV